MAIRLMGGLTARIVTVLQDFMPAELTLIDAEEADGITTPRIPNGYYNQYDQQPIGQLPAVSMRTVSSIPLEVYDNDGGNLSMRTNHRIDVMFHASLREARTDPLELQKLMHRYVKAAARVLCILKPGLETAANPVKFVENVWWQEPAIYGPEAEQEGGTRMRTATLPLSITRHEQR